VVRFDGTFHGELAHVTVRGGAGIALTNASPLVRNVIVAECASGDAACIDQSAGDLATFVNVLVAGNAAPVAFRITGAASHLWNVTIADNTGAALALEDAAVLVERSIIARNGGAAVEATGASAGARLDHTLVWGNGSGVPAGIDTPDLVEEDPLFVSGPLHDHYLSQLGAGDGADSPALDAGGVPADSLEIAELTTATSGAGDEGPADLGFHAWPMAPPAPGEDIGGEDAGSDAGSDAGPGAPDVTGDPDALDAVGGDDATDAEAGEGQGPEGCGSCQKAAGPPVVPAGGLVLVALVLFALLGLRRRAASGRQAASPRTGPFVSARSAR
jgi:hypothetical protein